MSAVTFNTKNTIAKKKYSYSVFMRLVFAFSLFLIYNLYYYFLSIGDASILQAIYILFTTLVNTAILFFLALAIVLIIYHSLMSWLSAILYYLSIFICVLWGMIAYRLFTMFHIQMHVYALHFLWNWRDLLSLQLSTGFWVLYVVLVILIWGVLAIIKAYTGIYKKNLPFNLQRVLLSSILFYVSSCTLIFIIHLSLFEWFISQQNPAILQAKMRLPFLITSPFHFPCHNNSDTCAKQNALYNYLPNTEQRILTSSTGTVMKTTNPPNIILLIADQASIPLTNQNMPLVTQLTNNWQHLLHHYTSNHDSEQALNDLLFSVPFISPSSSLPIRDWLIQNNYDVRILSSLALHKDLPINKYIQVASTQSSWSANKQLSEKIIHILKHKKQNKSLFLVAYYNQKKQPKDIQQQYLRLDKTWGKIIISMETLGYANNSLIGLTAGNQTNSPSKLTDLQVPFVVRCSFCISGYLATKRITSHWQFLPSFLTLVGGPKIPSAQISWLDHKNTNFAYTKRTLFWFNKSYQLEITPLALWDPITLKSNKTISQTQEKKTILYAFKQFHDWENTVFAK